MKLKQILLQTIFCAGGLLSFVSCNEFLDMEPLDQVTPQEYFTTTDHLAAYSISQYNDLFTTHGGYGAGTVNNDQNTDNMIAGGYSSDLFEKGQWRVPNSDDNWKFSQIRYCNYFFETVMPKFESGKIEGDRTQNLHYIGEMYFIRAWIYYKKLKMFGDFPIITEVLTDDQPTLTEKSVRQPRNIVARYIISQLDSAITYMSEDISGNKTRLTRDCALLVKSRVALYEATFEKYHKGSGRVPGDANWPGKKSHPDFNTNIDNEVNFFLDQAMSAAEQIADKVTLTNNTEQNNPIDESSIIGWNPYFEMFAAEDMKGYSEVLFWKQYMNASGVSITHGAPAYIYSGGNNGMLKSFVDCFIMEDGKPYYKSNKYMGDKTIMDVKENRDSRLQMFVLGEKDKLPSSSTGDGKFSEFKQPNIISVETQTQDNTGYRIRKCLTYDYKQIISGQSQSTTGCIIFRGVEAHLNYLEAYYLRNNRIDGKAASYWNAIRTRAGITGSFQTTIDNTDMSQETDLAAHPGSYEVDPTLYNIRRERRCEFIGEGMRSDDLIRWRAWDGVLTKKFIPEGYNFWETTYLTYELPEDVKLNDNPDDATANISSRNLSKYIRPFSKVRANNQVYDGYTWSKANYLYPIAINEMRLASPDNSVDNSVIYQNPYWPTTIGGTALE